MGWRRFFRRAQWDRERSEEIESYIRIETDENLACGMPYGEAHAAARRKFGNSTLVREDIYGMNTLALVDSLGHDVRYGLRLLRHNPMFTSVALLTLAIGIGANTAVFSVVNSVLLKPLPYPQAEQLVAVWHKAPGAPGLTSVSGGLHLSASMYFTYAGQNRTFQSIGVWNASTANVTGLAEPERVPAVYISDGALQALSVPPAAGRWLGPADQKPSGAATVMLGYGYWQRRFGGDRSVIGRNITIDSRPTEIVGVMPRGFRFVNADFDLILPLAFDRATLRLPGFGYDCVARLKPGVTIAQADADLARLVPVWMRSWPAAPGINPLVYENWRITPAIRPLKQEVVGNVGNVLWVVMGTIGMVMLIACANVANLLLVRAEARQQELALRAALGAGWGRIVRELLLESMLLGAGGGALGLALAIAGLQFLAAVGPASLPRLGEISVDARALAFTVALSLVSAMLFGSITALKYAGPGISPALRGGGRTASQSRERHRARGVLVVAQVALALVLLIGSGLMMRTFQKLRTVEPGFTHPEHLQLMRIFIPPSLVREPEQVVRMQNEILDKLAAIPEVSGAAFTSEMPMDAGPGHDWDVIIAEGKPGIASEVPPLRIFQSVSPGLFQTTGTGLLAGRDYTWTDLYGRRPLAIVSENLARELWGSAQAAIGKRISTALPAAPWREVIGVVQDVRQNGVQEPAPAIVYWPSFGQNIYLAAQVQVARGVTFAIRTARAGSAGLVSQIQQAVWSVNPSLPVAEVRTMQEVYNRSLARTSFTLVMLGIASVMALFLGIIGIYGVISYAVSQRRREIGIRLALGAPPAELSRMFVRYGLMLAAAGAVIGVAAAGGLTQLMRALLFGVSPLDPLTYGAVTLVLVAAAALASYLPARRAAAVDPVETLRAE
ncbi:MAG TPA: ABC transporter permease [Bryobacteraceae bacterium]|nr:ABC transporter permease [Bryobacteraceae bacterium]